VQRREHFQQVVIGVKWFTLAGGHHDDCCRLADACGIDRVGGVNGSGTVF
jgi:hypothetical protein